MKVGAVGSEALIATSLSLYAEPTYTLSDMTAMLRGDRMMAVSRSEPANDGAVGVDTSTVTNALEVSETTNT